ncbi:MAG: adenylate/guanylate cyclase domain-containing protein [Rhodospirillaceae bacterium]|jgi:adenylate cyclase|nr:adenylate/guanylate cyclase domain-containing protein [Rhodospirillaceae bacterium]
MGSKATNTELDGIDAPYPLRARFRMRVLPVLLAVMAALLVLAGWGGRAVIEDVFLERARHAAEGLAGMAERVAPDAWRRVVESDPRYGAPPPDARDALHALFSAALGDSRLHKLKIYDENGRVLYSSEPRQAGEIEREPLLEDVLRERESVIAPKHLDGVPVYEFYIDLPARPGRPRLVFELYEPAIGIDAILWRNLLPAVMVPAALLLGVILLMWGLVGRAQADIEARTETLAGLKNRLGRLVSNQAGTAALHPDPADPESGLASRAIDATLYFADVRDFTGFAENEPPERVIAFLNTLLAIQVEAIRRHGGDVDKFIGDAVLAVFEGPDRAMQAVACAQDVLATLSAREGLARGIGVGLHDCRVIAGTVGPPERQDFTVIGDGVNVAARLCAVAQSFEIVTDVATLSRAGQPGGFSAPAGLEIRGRAEALRVRRWRPDGAAG